MTGEPDRVGGGACCSMIMYRYCFHTGFVSAKQIIKRCETRAFLPTIPINRNATKKQGKTPQEDLKQAYVHYDYNTYTAQQLPIVQQQQYNPLSTVVRVVVRSLQCTSLRASIGSAEGINPRAAWLDASPSAPGALGPING